MNTEYTGWKHKHQPKLFLFSFFLMNGKHQPKLIRTFSSLQVSRQFSTFNHVGNIGTSEGKELRRRKLRKLDSII